MKPPPIAATLPSHPKDTLTKVIPGGPIRTLRAGHMVTLVPFESHLHGATPTSGMSRTDIHEVQDGRSKDWLEPVSDVDCGTESEG